MSLITVEQARSGHPILKVDGRGLCSSFDPIKEATSWAEKAVVDAGDAESVFVLGLGAGYHSEALRARLPGRLVVTIEGDSSLAKEAISIHPQLKAAPIVVEPEWHRLIEHAVFRDALAGRYAIVKHGPSCQIHSDYFNGVERLLIGREKIAFLLQLKTRPDLYSLFDPAAIESMSPELVSIKTIQGLFSVGAATSRERRMWKLLEELIA